MVLGGYFDESERDDALDPICVGGYIFKPSGYGKFRKRWRHAVKLGSRNCYPFHTTDLVAGKGVYRGLTIPERVILLDHAVAAVTSYAYCGVAVYFDKDEFEAVAPPEWPDVFGSIYSAACQMALAVTANHLINKKRCHLNVLYVFEQGHKYEDEVDRILKSIRNNPEHRKTYRYRNHLFEEKDKEIGLQAADLLAWTVTKLESGGWKARSFGAFLPSILKLGGKQNDQVPYINLTGAKLRRLIDESVRAFHPDLLIDLGQHKRGFR